MELLQRVIKFQKEEKLFQQQDRLLLAVSGGVDSVTLCKLCAMAGYDFAIAHCNFQLRGTDSTRDEDFVKALAAKYQVPFHVIRFNTKAFAEDEKLSTQEAARVLRYDWFASLMNEYQYQYLLTAHHADDSMETMLMNFFRGTGLKGLTGIPVKNGYIVRPLLFARRQELEDFVKAHQLDFVQDESNLHDDYTRNFLRNTLLPQVAGIFPEVKNNLLQNMARFRDAAALLQDTLQTKFKRLVTTDGDKKLVPVLLLQQQQGWTTILYELLKAHGFTAAQTAEAVKLLHSESGHYIESATHRLLRNRKHLILYPRKEKETSFLIINGPGKYAFSEGTLQIDMHNGNAPEITGDPQVALLDAAKITYPLIVRPWQTGDYFYPLGMQKKKKLSRFLIDKKLSLADKEKVWVVEMQKKIVWVVGYRIDDRFKITTAPAGIVSLRYCHPGQKG